MQAYRQASEMREAVNIGFDNLPMFFAQANHYFKIYSGDQNIFQASVKFVLMTLKAIEEAIMFYTSTQGK